MAIRKEQFKVQENGSAAPVASAITTTANISGAQNVIVPEKKKEITEEFNDIAGSTGLVGDDTMYDHSTHKIIPESLDNPGVESNQPASNLLDLKDITELNYHIKDKKDVKLSEMYDPFSTSDLNQAGYDINSSAPIDSSGINGLNAGDMTVRELSDVTTRGNINNTKDTPLAGNFIPSDKLGKANNSDPSPEVSLHRIDIISEADMEYVDFDDFLDNEHSPVEVNGRTVPYSISFKATDPSEYAKLERQYYDNIGHNNPNDIKKYSVDNEHYKESLNEGDTVENKEKILDILEELLERVDQIYDLLEVDSPIDTEENESDDEEIQIDEPSSEDGSAGDSEEGDIVESMKSSKQNLTESKTPVLQGNIYIVKENGKQVGFGLSGKIKPDGRVLIGTKEFDSKDPKLQFLSTHIGQ